MKKLLTIAAIFCFTLTGYSQTIWLFDNASGLGDGTSWNDANNWTDNAGVLPSAVPSAGDEARLALNNAVITGTVPNIPGSVVIGGAKTITLDLDLTIGDGTGAAHGITMFNNAILNIAAGRTITINVPANKEAIRLNSGKTNTLNIAATAVINIQQCLNGILCEDATHTLDNDGTINITGATGSGILLTNGTIINDGTIDISSNVGVGVNYDAGTFTNNGTLTVTNSTTECVTVAAANFTNTGTMNLTSAGTTSVHNCIDVETGGTLTNSGDIIGNAGAASARAVSVVGVLDNSGTITLSGGNTGRSLSNDGGTINNNVCGMIDLTNTRMNNNSGTFTNNGFIKSTYGQGLLNTGTTNNYAFYSWGSGAWTVDNGINVSSGNFTVDALSSCAVTDIGIDAAYTWYSDAAATTQAGTNDVAGVLTIDNGAYPGTAGNKTAYSCFGAEFTMTINNVDGGCLPVELLFFNGKLDNEMVVLNWATASELNNAGFEIQKSINGTDWETLEFVEGNGTTLEVQNYDFEDAQPFAGRNYYRLKQLDFDGKFEFSNIVTVTLDNRNQVNATVYPNPTKGSFTVELETAVSGQAVIYNVFGQAIKTVQLNNQTNQISLEEFANGTYYIQIVSGNTVENQTIIKQ